MMIYYIFLIGNGLNIHFHLQSMCLDYNGYNLLLNVIDFMGYVLFLNFIKNTINLIIYTLNLKFIDYVRFKPVKQVKQDVKDSTFSQKKSMHKLPNVPEAFKEKYFPEK